MGDRYLYSPAVAYAVMLKLFIFVIVLICLTICHCNSNLICIAFAAREQAALPLRLFQQSGKYYAQVVFHRVYGQSTILQRIADNVVNISNDDRLEFNYLSICRH